MSDLDEFAGLFDGENEPPEITEAMRIIREAKEAGEKPDEEKLEALYQEARKKILRQVIKLTQDDIMDNIRRLAHIAGLLDVNPVMVTGATHTVDGKKNDYLVAIVSGQMTPEDKTLFGEYVKAFGNEVQNGKTKRVLASDNYDNPYGKSK